MSWTKARALFFLSSEKINATLSGPAVTFKPIKPKQLSKGTTGDGGYKNKCHQDLPRSGVAEDPHLPKNTHKNNVSTPPLFKYHGHARFAFRTLVIGLRKLYTSASCLVCRTNIFISTGLTSFYRSRDM